MNSDRGFETTTAEWLNAGSDMTPPHVTDAVLLAVRSTPQERDYRISWRTSPRKRLAYGMAAVAALAVSVTALSALSPRFGIGPEPTPREEPSVDLGIFEPVAGRIVYGDEDGIWAVDPAAPADPATRVQLTSEAGIPLGWSSDGTRLLILRGSRGEEGLFVLHADGSETPVTERPMSINGATLSPDGSRVVFAASTSGTGSALYAVDAGDGPPERLLGPGEHLIQQPTFSPDGLRIAYAIGGGDHSNNVWLMEADGSDAHPIVSNEANEWPGHVRGGLAWSPAGDQMALGLGGKIYTFETSGSDLTEITGAETICNSASSCAIVLPSSAESPYWSPDGSQIAYTTGCVEGAGAANRAGCNLAIADADGSNVREFGYGASGPWHPAGGTQSDEEAHQPTPAEMVLHFQSWSTGDDGATVERTAVAIYADGRVIWNADEQADYVELRLTPEGIEGLRSRAVSTGLFEQDLALGLDLGTGNIEVRRGDRSVIVAWGKTPVNVSGLGLEHLFVEATPAQAGELTELEAFFRDPAAWALPAEMYRQSEITPFVPTHLVFGFDRAVPDLSNLPSPPPEIVTRYLEPMISGRCQKISLDQAREVVDALVQADEIAPIDDIRLGFAFYLGRSFVHFRPALPDEPNCP